MTDKIDTKKRYDPKNGVTLTFDSHGNCFVSMPVNNIPKKQFDDWMRKCNNEYSGKRWDMIIADNIKAQAYDAMMISVQAGEDLPEEKEINPDGLLNGGQENDR